MPQTERTIPENSSAEDEINLLDLLLVLAKRWRIIVGVPFAVAVITTIITLFMPNIYTAKTTIIPSEDNSGGMKAVLMAQLGGLAGKTTADLYATMLKSETLHDPIIDRKSPYREAYKYRSANDYCLPCSSTSPTDSALNSAV